MSEQWNSDKRCYEVPTNKFRFHMQNRYSPKILQQWWSFVRGNGEEGEWRDVPLVIEEL